MPRSDHSGGAKSEPIVNDGTNASADHRDHGDRRDHANDGDRSDRDLGSSRSSSRRERRCRAPNRRNLGRGWSVVNHVLHTRRTFSQHPRRGNKMVKFLPATIGTALLIWLAPGAASALPAGGMHAKDIPGTVQRIRDDDEHHHRRYHDEDHDRRWWWRWHHRHDRDEDREHHRRHHHDDDRR